MTSEQWNKVVTCEAPINMAVIKYWGKRDEELILPINSSLSATLTTQKMRSKTTVRAEETSHEEIKMWLNGKSEEVSTNKRLLSCLKEIRKRANVQTPHRLIIVSENNFPTAAGLASSASGFCCLVFSLAQLYGLGGDISGIARYDHPSFLPLQASSFSLLSLFFFLYLLFLIRPVG
jgi:diphosphomevalonate decarboxylase